MRCFHLVLWASALNDISNAKVKAFPFQPTIIYSAVSSARVRSIYDSKNRKGTFISLYESDPRSKSDESFQSSDSRHVESAHVQQISNSAKVEAVLYRVVLIIGSISYSFVQISSSLYGSGISSLIIDELSIDFKFLSTWTMLLAALFAPAYSGAVTDRCKKNEVNNVLFLITNECLPQLAGFAIFFEVLNFIQQRSQYFPVPWDDIAKPSTSMTSIASYTSTLENTELLFIALICVREIGFYGAGYKAEAILAILLCVAITFNDMIGFSNAALEFGLSLCLLVLSFSKVFEPLQDDIIPGGSSFFSDSL